MQEKINYGGWPNCVRLSNEEVEIIITTDIGPRIVRCGFLNKQNFFYLSPQDSGRMNDIDWRIYGGHRFWHAPEAIPRSYSPDNAPVHYSWNGITLNLTQSVEPATGIVKEMNITLSPDKNEITVVHHLINQNLWDIQAAPWALSVLAQGGRAIIPQEPYGAGDDFLLPARSLALWQYTKMNDSRWIWGDKYIQAKQDPAIISEQKIGIMNRQGWAAYYLNGEILIKRFDFDAKALYPDFGCNNEIYINGNFLEIETLGALAIVPPFGMIQHTEQWLLGRVHADESEESIHLNILPIVNSFQN